MSRAPGAEALERLRARGLDPAVAPLADLERALGDDPTLAAALVLPLAERPTEESVRLLAEIERTAAAAKDKTLRREARRALYRLEQKGVVRPAAPATAAAATILAGAPETEGFLSISDVRGDRILWIVKPKTGGGLHHLTVVVNEPAGLVEAMLAETTRKQLRELADEIARRHGLRLVPVDAAYADWIATEGFERARERNALSARAAQLAQLRTLLFARPAEPRALDLRALAESRRDPAADLAASHELFGETELEHWFLPEPVIGPYLERAHEIRSSPIVLDRAVQLARIDEIAADASHALFSGPAAASWARRLDELAHVFWKTDRGAAAGRALAAAAALRATTTGGRGIPFTDELVRRTLALFFAHEAEKEREDKASSVLVTPDDLRAEEARRRSRPRP